MIPVITPMGSITKAMIVNILNGIKNNAAVNCPRLCPIAPNKLTDIKLIRLCIILKKGSTKNRKKRLPPRAAKNGNEKSVPLNKCVNNNLKLTIKKIFFNCINGKAKHIGIFASPRRKNGTGVGMKLSNILKNALIAANEAVKSFSFIFTLLLRQLQRFVMVSF